MKILYKTPEITVEELTKADVLCSSGGAAPTPAQDNLTGTYGGTNGVGSNSFDFDTGSFLTP
jgi:hypothetical protein